METTDRLTGETFVHAIFPNAVNQARVAAYNLLGWDVTYEGSDNMNSLKHLGLQVMAVGLKEGDEILQEKRDGTLRTIYVKENHLVGFQLAGDIRGAGILRTLMIQGTDIRPIKDRLLDPSFGQGAMVWRAIESYA